LIFVVNHHSSITNHQLEITTMMAKMFYTLDETRAALGKNEEEIKQYTREGRLREFRDGPRLMFKADQVESLKNELGLGATISDTGQSDSGAPIGLIDSRTASATGISLMDTDVSGRSGTGGGMQLKDDTAMAGDLGSAGSATGIPSSPNLSLASGSMAGTRAGSGVNVLGDSASPADPMAQTAISSGVPDQVSLEGVGSGSGLLDLTRESDDTSLGAELLDEIAPGGSKRGTKGGTGAIGGSSAGQGTAVGGSTAGAAAITGRSRVSTPIFVESADPLAPAFGGAALAAAVMLLFAGFALTSAVLGTRPALLVQVQSMSLLVLLAIGVGMAILFAIIGAVVGKSMR
jgi:hypothetical protein